VKNAYNVGYTFGSVYRGSSVVIAACAMEAISALVEVRIGEFKEAYREEHGREPQPHEIPCLSVKTLVQSSADVVVSK
jgi:hypothetical protein